MENEEKFEVKKSTLEMLVARLREQEQIIYYLSNRKPIDNLVVDMNQQIVSMNKLLDEKAVTKKK